MSEHCVLCVEVKEVLGSQSRGEQDLLLCVDIKQVPGLYVPTGFKRKENLMNFQNWKGPLDSLVDLLYGTCHKRLPVTSGSRTMGSDGIKI